MAKIKCLTKFQHPETFEFLLSRVSEIRILIANVKKIRAQPKELADLGINTPLVVMGCTGYACVLYRSFFQSASWERVTRDSIEPEAYYGSNFSGSNNEKIHEEIKGYVDYVVAHQDLLNSQGDASANEQREQMGLRGICRNPSTGAPFRVKGNMLVYNYRHFHIDTIEPLLDSIERAIKATKTQLGFG